MTKKLCGTKRPIPLRHLLTTVAVLLLFALMFVAPVMAETITGVCGKPLEDTTEFTNTVTWSFNTETGELTISGNGDMANLKTDLQSTPDIDDDNRPWKTYLSEIKTVTITNGVTHIGNNAFYGCTNLASISLPNSLKSIGNYAFYDCEILESITLPESLTSIGESAFRECTKLTDVEFSATSSLNSIGRSAFRSCTALESIILPDSLTSMGGGITFYGCTSLTSVTLPNSLTSIGSMTFDGCISLTTVNLPDSLKSIEATTFSNCKSLKNINLPASITSIGDRAFQNCHSLESINLPESLQSIGNYAFIHCDALETINLPDSLQSIGNFAFDDCDTLASINLPDSLQSIGDHAFHKCYALTFVKFPSSLESVGDSALQYAHIDVIDLTHMAPDITIGGNNVFAKITTLTNNPLIIYKNASTDPGMASEPNPGVAYAITNGGKFEGRDAYTNDGTLATPKRDRYAFLQWYKIEDESETVATTVESGKTYYAKWKYTITFDANGGEGTTNSLTDITEGDTTTPLTTNGFSRTGYEFVGWNTKADGSGDFYADASTTKPSGDTTLYAQWVMNIQDKSGVTYTIGAIVDQTYTGAEIKPTVTVISDNAELTESIDYSVEYSGDLVNVGEVTVTITIGESTEAELKFTIIQDQNPTVSMADMFVTYGESYDMDPVAKTSGNKIITDGEITIKYYSDAECTQDETETPPTNVGVYYAKATLSGTKNYVTVFDTAKIEIINADFGSSLIVKGYEDTYDGQPHSITIIAEGAEITYSTDGNTYTNENPTYTKAGIYTVYFKVTKSNYNTVTSSVTINIKKAQPDVEITVDKPVLLGGGTVIITASESEGAVAVTCDDSSVTIKEHTVGKYSATLPDITKEYVFTASYAESTNYTAHSTKYAVSVKKSEVTVTGVNLEPGYSMGVGFIDQTEKSAIEAEINEKFVDKTFIFVDISLIKADGTKDSTTPVTFVIGYPAGINANNCQNYNFVVLHLKGGVVEVVPATLADSGLQVTSTLSPFAIGYSVKQTGGSSTPQGSSVWLQEPLTPTPTETAQPTPTDVAPTDIPTTQPTPTQTETPGFGVLAVLAGLGAVAVLRRK